jgi:hypothetical protein
MGQYSERPDPRSDQEPQIQAPGDVGYAREAPARDVGYPREAPARDVGYAREAPARDGGHAGEAPAGGEAAAAGPRSDADALPDPAAMEAGEHADAEKEGTNAVAWDAQDDTAAKWNVQDDADAEWGAREEADAVAWDAQDDVAAKWDVQDEADAEWDARDADSVGWHAGSEDAVDAESVGWRAGDEDAEAWGAGETVGGAAGVPGEPEQRPATGEPRVDAALARLDELAGRPVTEHRAIFDDVHRRLKDVLGELDTREQNSRDQPAASAAERRAGR